MKGEVAPITHQPIDQPNGLDPLLRIHWYYETRHEKAISSGMHQPIDPISTEEMIDKLNCICHICHICHMENDSAPRLLALEAA